MNTKNDKLGPILVFIILWLPVLLFLLFSIFAEKFQHSNTIEQENTIDYYNYYYLN